MLFQSKRALREYAQKRFLEENSSEMLRAMDEKGTLTEHLAAVEMIVEDYIDARCENVKKTERYLNANAAQQIRIVQSEHVFSRQDAFSMWVYVLPDC